MQDICQQRYISQTNVCQRQYAIIIREISFEAISQVLCATHFSPLFSYFVYGFSLCLLVVMSSPFLILSIDYL